MVAPQVPQKQVLASSISIPFKKSGEMRRVAIDRGLLTFGVRQLASGSATMIWIQAAHVKGGEMLRMGFNAL